MEEKKYNSQMDGPIMNKELWMNPPELNKSNPQDKLNQGHYLELMDRLHVVMCTIDNHCIQHPLAKTERSIRNLLYSTIDNLYDAYQEVGKLEYERYKNN
jgi:hypothetical protein